MKQIVAISVLFFALIGGVLFFARPNEQSNQTYLRVHIRANSNNVEDQNVKYLIKEEVVTFLTPLLVEGKTLEKAKEILQNNLSNIESVSNKVLAQSGFSYSAVAKLNQEFFPTRSYSEHTLESGLYDALILELGTAEGDNWWCVVYPPLCFVSSSSGNIIYHSKILEIIEKFKEKRFP